MRRIALALLLLTGPLSVGDVGSRFPAALVQVARAQPNSVNGRRLEDAPISRLPPDGVSPSDRVAGPGGLTLDAGPSNGTPFSSTPSGTLSGGGTPEADSDTVRESPDSGRATPNLSR